MPSSANSISKVEIVKAELSEFEPPFRVDAFYVWYEWDGSDYTRTYSTTTRKWRAKAMYTSEKDTYKRGSAMRAAVTVVELTREGGAKLIDDMQAISLTNDTLDNLVMLFFMKHNKLFDVEKKLTNTPI
jgi:hypothetical protein